MLANILFCWKRARTQFVTLQIASLLLIHCCWSIHAFGSCKDPLYPGSELTYSRVKSLISKNEITTIDGLVECLPLEYRSNYTLFHTSKSAQKATYEKPRVILYGTNAELVLTFNAEGAPNSAFVELIEYNKESHLFIPRKIEFHEGTKVPPVFHDNPTGCTSCHRMNFRPNWDSYAAWPGAYGGYEDGLLSETKEYDQFIAFQQEAPSLPRYRYLRPLKLVKKKGDAFQLQCENSDIQPHMGQQNDYRINTQFTASLSSLNFSRIISIIQKSPDFDKFKYAILAASYDCSISIEKFLPEDLRSRFTTRYDFFLEDTKKVIAAEYEARILKVALSDRYYASIRPPTNFDMENAQTLAILRYLFENRGISMLDWSMASNPDYSFADGGNFHSVQRWFYWIRDLVHIERGKTDKEICGQLQTLSLQAFSPISLPPL
jgi:hypothetical protein